MASFSDHKEQSYHGVAYSVVRRNRCSVLIVVCVPMMRGRGGGDVGMRPGGEWASVGEPHLGLIPALDPFLS